MAEEIIARGVLVIAMAGSGVLQLWMASATAGGRLGRNQIAGIRTPATLESDEAWLAGHRRAKRSGQYAGWCAIVTGLLALTPIDTWVVVVAVLVGAMLMLVFVLYGASVGGRAARATTAATQNPTSSGIGIG